MIVEFDPHDPDDHDFEQTCRYGVSETACKQGSTNSKSNGGCFKLVFSRIEFTKLRDYKCTTGEINPFAPWCDQLVMSPYIMNTLSIRLVMRIKKIINWLLI